MAVVCTLYCSTDNEGPGKINLPANILNLCSSNLHRMLNILGALPIPFQKQLCADRLESHTVTYCSIYILRSMVNYVRGQIGQYEHFYEYDAANQVPR